MMTEKIMMVFLQIYDGSSILHFLQSQPHSRRDSVDRDLEYKVVEATLCVVLHWVHSLL